MATNRFTGKKIEDYSREELIEVIKDLRKRKKFGIVWEAKPEDVVEQCKSELPVLKEEKNRAITKGRKDITNLIIEGDNYHALSVLSYTHNRKIDFIYIDPPYNTGASDWKYNNDYVDINDHYRHSKWLAMMYNRLRLAKNLLKPDGILVVTIDDNELFHLGAQLEELFPRHDIFIVTIEHNRRGRRGKNFAKTNEWAIFLVPKGAELIQEEKSEEMIGGETRNLRRTGSGSKRRERPRKFYPIWVNKKTLEVVSAGDPIALAAKWRNQKKGDLVTVWPVDETGAEKNWHYGVERTRECIKNGQLEARIRDYGIQIYYTLREKTSKKYKTVWSKPIYDASTHGSVLLQKILGNEATFDYPKSIYAVIECLRAAVGSRKNAVILDFFAGSGTTGHATLLLNKEDKGSRQFILVTNNENGIAEQVTYPRIKNVINGVRALPELTNLPANVRYFRTDFVRKDAVSDNTRRMLVARSTEMICIRENTFEEEYESNQYKIYTNGKIVTGILFDLDSIDDFKKILTSLKMPARLYVFSLSSDVFADDFSDLQVKYKLCPIPESILEVYRRIFV